MMGRHFRLSSELSGAIAKRLPHAKNQLSTPGSFFNPFVTDICTVERQLSELQLSEHFSYPNPLVDQTKI